MDNKDKFTMSVRETRSCSVKCIHCQDLKVERGLTVEEFVAKMGLLGWRYVKSEKLRREGPMCEACATMPDSQRGGE